MTLTDKEKVEAIRKTFELIDRGFEDESGYVELIRDIMDSKMTMAEVDECIKDNIEETLTDKEKVEAIRKTLELADRGFDDEPGYVELIRDIMDSKMTMAEVDEVSKITLKKNER